MLLIPVRHVGHVELLSPEEFCDLHFVLQEMVKHIKVEFQADGYNLGVNSGEVAGQTLSHLHIHLIPRYLGDVPNPRGGVRNFLPNPLREAVCSSLFGGRATTQVQSRDVDPLYWRQ